MEINLENLRKFVASHGAQVEIVDSTGKTRKIRPDEPDIWELVEKADKFRVEGKWYSRADFAKLMENRLKPANAMQIPLPTDGRQ
jgi:hypothetical protein